MAVIRPEELSRQTHALFVGISQYTDPGLVDLTSAASEVGNLVAVVADANGCAVPDSNITCITNEKASKCEVLAALETLTSFAAEKDTLFFYFAGHAVNSDEEFYLCPSDCRVDELSDSAISGRDLQDLFVLTAARGVLVLLDCCGGAGLADKAPSFFRSLAGSDYRILLTATREDRDAYEPADGTGTLFSKQLQRILEGKHPAGYDPGKIYFSGLYEALYFGLAGDDQAVVTQEPIFIGSYARDPLVFVHRDLLLSDFTVDTSRISRAHMQRLIRNLAISAAALVIFGWGTWVAWLDGHEYVVLGRTELQVNQGYPSLNAFGYPVLIEERSYTADEFEENSVLRQEGYAVAPIGYSAQYIINDSLKPAFAALRHVANGDIDSARTVAWRILKSTSAVEEGAWDVLVASMVLPDIVLPADEPDVQHLLDTTPQFEVRTNTVKALLAINAEAAFDVLSTHPSDDFEHVDLLNELQAPCSLEKQQYLLGRVLAAELHNDGLFLVDTALRLGCQFDNETLEKIVLAFTFDQIEATAALLDQISSDGILDYLRRRAPALSATNQLRVATAIAAALGPTACAIEPTDIESIQNLSWQLRAIDYSASCVGVGYAINMLGPDKIVVTESHKLIQPIELNLSDLDYSEAMILLRLMRRFMAPDELQKQLPAVLNSSVESVVKAKIIQTLGELGADFFNFEGKRDHENSVELRSALVRWQAKTDLAGARNYVFKRIEDRDFFEFPDLLSSVGVECASINEMANEVNASSPLEDREVIALTTFASHEILEKLLTHKRVAVRDTARDYALLNPAVDALLISDDAALVRDIERLVSRRDNVLEELATLPENIRILRAALIVSARKGATSSPEQFLSSGLFLLLRRLVSPPFGASSC